MSEPAFYLTGEKGIGYTVLHDYVVVWPDELDSIAERRPDGTVLTDGGAWVPPDVAKELYDKIVTGTVVGVGHGFLVKDGPSAGKLVPMPLREGDRVYHSFYGVTDITVAGETLKMLHYDPDVRMVEPRFEDV